MLDILYISYSILICHTVIAHEHSHNLRHKVTQNIRKPDFLDRNLRSEKFRYSLIICIGIKNRFVLEMWAEIAKISWLCRLMPT